jgi:hypothetical protein
MASRRMLRERAYRKQEMARAPTTSNLHSRQILEDVLYRYMLCANVSEFKINKLALTFNILVHGITCMGKHNIVNPLTSGA